MSKLEYRVINANEKVEDIIIQNFNKQYRKIEKQVKPKDYQCIAINDIVAIKCTYDKDTIITVKTSRKKSVTGVDTYPEHIKEIFEKIKKKYKLNKKQFLEVVKILDKDFDDLETDIEKIEDLLINESTKIKIRDSKLSQINAFYNSYDKFNDCLTSELSEFDSETKDDIKIKLNNLIQLVEEDILKNYLK